MLGGDAVDTMTWEDSVTRFWAEFAPMIEVQQLARTLLVLQYVADEDMKKARYHEMLRSDIIQFVSRSSCKILDDMIVRAR